MSLWPAYVCVCGEIPACQVRVITGSLKGSRAALCFASLAGQRLCVTYSWAYFGTGKVWGGSEVLAEGFPTRMRSLEVFFSFPICLSFQHTVWLMGGLRIALYDVASVNTLVSKAHSPKVKDGSLWPEGCRFKCRKIALKEDFLLSWTALEQGH